MDDSSRNPYQAPDARIVEPAVAVKHPLAGRGERLGAAVIDTLLLLVLFLPLMFVGGYFERLQSTSVPLVDALVTDLLWQILGFAVFLLLQGYPLYMKGQTWGKRILGIRIIGVDGRPLPFVRLVSLRYLPLHLIGIVPFAGQLLSIVNVLLIFRADHRCGHDLLAGTIVVRDMTPAAMAAHERP
jgi:uncharacterized RDD family membrane protein YckC